MSKRRRGVSKSKLGRRYQSDFINVTQRPRSLIIDPVCDRCHGRKWVRKPWIPCKRCRGSGKDPEGDKWFDNHDRVKTTTGPSHNQSHRHVSTYVMRTFDKRMHRVIIREGRDKYSFVDPKYKDPAMESCMKAREIIKYYPGYRATERPIPKTRGIGSPMINEKGEWETPASSAVNYTYDHLPRLKAIEKIEILTSSTRLTIIERMDKFTTIRRDAKSWLKLFYVGDKYCFVEEFENYARRSLVYTGREYALNRFRSGRLEQEWVEIL